MVGVLSSYGPPGMEVHSTGVQMASLSKCLDLWFWAFQAPPKGVPDTLHYLCLDIAPDIMGTANSDSILDCQVSKKSAQLLLYTALHLLLVLGPAPAQSFCMHSSFESKGLVR